MSGNWLRRDFLDPREGILNQVVDRLVQRYRRDLLLDLKTVTLVLPSTAATRRLLQRLLAVCDEQGWELVPPRITTVGHLPELLYPSRKPFAEDVMQVFAWSRALRESDSSELRPILAEPPAADDQEAWLELAQTLQGVHRELASEGKSMADVAAVFAEEPGFEQLRWRSLAKIQTRYLETLDRLGYWDRQTARLFAVEHQECHALGELVVVGAVDLNQTMRAMLEQVEDQTWLIQVAAGGIDLDIGFDRHGCLDEEYWTLREIDLENVDRVIVETHEDQAAAAMEFLQQQALETDRDDLVVGVLDESLVPYLERIGEEFSVEFESAAGEPMDRQSLYRMLEQLLEWLTGRTFRSLASLVRHPTLFENLCRVLEGDDWLPILDRYQTEQLPSIVIGELKSETRFSRVIEAIDRWCALVSREESLPLRAWKEAWFETLSAILGDRLLDREDESWSDLRVLEAIRDAWVEIDAVPEELQPSMTAAAGMKWVLRRISRQRVSGPVRARSLPLIGWLDLPWSDVSRTVVLGFNEGHVPTPEPLDPLLPNALRRRLQVMHSARRFARDAYYLSLLTDSQKQLRLVAGKREPSGDPLVPSRLWFADTASVLVERALEAFDRPAVTYELLGSAQVEAVSGGAMGGLPEPDSTRRPKYLSPTDFSRYIECPYRFFLERVCRLQGSDDESEELSAGQFGDLLHAVLAKFGRSESWKSSDPSEIMGRLEGMLESEVKKRVAQVHLPAVDLQVEHVRQRLRAFSQAQARWAAEGWKIEGVELSFHGTLVTEKGTSVPIHGRIDRIDRHEDGKRVALLDYKSSDSGRRPNESHRNKTGWIDLQLPLYQWLVEHGVRMEGEAELEVWCDEIEDFASLEYRLGFILLGQSKDDTQFAMADWSATELEQAIETAREQAQLIWDGVYWPPGKQEAYKQPYDAFARILSLDNQGS